VVLAVSKVTTLDEVLELPLPEATRWVAELEGPEEVAGLLEVGANSVDLVDQVFHAHDTELAQLLFDDRVVGKRNALLLDLAITPLVDELRMLSVKALKVWVCRMWRIVPLARI